MYPFHLNQQWMLTLQRGEKIVESITNFARDNEIKGGSISGIGAIENVELGCFRLNQKAYQRKTFDQSEYELLHLSGNISLKNNDYFSHVHAVLADANYQSFGGHLFEATVAVTAEVFITPFGAMPARDYNDSIGLDLICRIQE